MRAACVPALALLLAALTACSGAPDTAAAERDLAGVDGVVDADAQWVEGSFKVAPSAAVSVAVGADLGADSARELAPRLLDVLADLDWDASPDLVVELDDDADATPFLQRLPDDEQVPRPTDVSTYTASLFQLDDRDLAADLALLLDARDTLGSPTQLETTGEDTLGLSSTLDVDADTSVALVREASTQQSLTSEEMRWRVTGPDLTLELESGLTGADAKLWAAVVGGSVDLGGLTRTRVVLSIDRERPLAVLRLELATDGPAADATQPVAAPARRLFRQLSSAGLDEVQVTVRGNDEALSRSFYDGDASQSWAPAG